MKPRYILFDEVDFPIIWLLICGVSTLLWRFFISSLPLHARLKDGKMVRAQKKKNCKEKDKGTLKGLRGIKYGKRIFGLFEMLRRISGPTKTGLLFFILPIFNETAAPSAFLKVSFFLYLNKKIYLGLLVCGFLVLMLLRLKKKKVLVCHLSVYAGL